jgi:hypothetical protein
VVVGHRPLAVEQVHAEVGAAVGEHRDRLAVQHGPVLDRTRPGANRPAGALGTVRVDRHEPVVQRRLFDRGPDLVL